jgi:ComEC/Rec2-related protein
MPLYLPRRLALAAALAWIGTFASFTDHGVFYVLAATLISMVLIKLSDAKPACWILILLPTIFYMQALLRKPAADQFDLSRFTGGTVVIKAQILEITEQRQFQRNILVVRPCQLCYPHEGRLSGKAEVILKGSAQPKLSIGSFVEIKGHVIEPTEPDEPWRFRQKTRLAQSSIFSVVITHGAGVSLAQAETTSTDLFESWITASRKSITDLHLATLGENYGPLLESIVLGDRCVALPTELVDKYRRVGLSHLLAASGFNLTIVIVVMHILAKSLTRSRTIRCLSALIPMTIFVVLAGLSPSVVRAAACSFIILIAIQSGRALSAAALLSLVLIAVLTIEPISAIDVGAQLSYAATFGILNLARPLGSFLETPIAKFKEKRKATDYLKWKFIRVPIVKTKRVFLVFAFWTVEAIAVVLSAQFAVLPIQLFYFWRLGTMFLPACVLVDPLVAPITVIGFAASTLILVSPLFQGICQQLDYLALLPLKALDGIATYFASMEGTYINLGPPQPATIVFYYAVLALFCVSLIARRFRIFATAMMFVSAYALLWRPTLEQPLLSIARNSLTFIGTDRRAITLGEESTAATKFLAYNGASVTQKIETVQGSDRPISINLASGTQRLKFILVSPEQIASLSKAPMADDRSTSAESGQFSHVILAVYNENIGSSNLRLRGRKKHPNISDELLDRLLDRFSADRVLLIEKHFFRKKNQSESSRASSPEPHFYENDDRGLAIFCEHGIEAHLSRRIAAVPKID